MANVSSVPDGRGFSSCIRTAHGEEAVAMILRRRRSAAFVHAALAATVVLAGLAPAFARERGPRVEVLCPAPPIAVKGSRVVPHG